MTDKKLKEERHHGDISLPVSCYRIQPPTSTLLGELECHWHDEMELFKVERGRVRVRCGSDYLLAQAGELVFFNSGELHAAQPLGGEEMDYAAVVFSPEILCGDENDIARRKYVAPVVEGKLHLPRLTSASTPEGRQVLELFNRVMDLLFQRPAAYELLVRAGLLELFASLASRGGAERPAQGTGAGRGHQGRPGVYSGALPPEDHGGPAGGDEPSEHRSLLPPFQKVYLQNAGAVYQRDAPFRRRGPAAGERPEGAGYRL